MSFPAWALLNPSADDLRPVLCVVALCLQSLNHWKAFFANHKKYFKVGTVTHPPIDPASPIPESCNKPKTEEAPKYGPRRANNEL